MSLSMHRLAAFPVTISVAVTLLIAAMALPTAQAAPEASFQPAYQAFLQGGAGDKAAVDRAATAFTDLSAAEPGNPVLMAYAGAATAMKAGTTMLPWKKMGYAEDGLAMIDKALGLLAPAHDAPLQHGTPGTLEARFIAASTFLAVPDFMNRNARGTALLGEVLQSPLFASSPLPFRGTVWMRAAALAQKQQRGGDAKRWLGEVVQHGAPQADQARAQLASAS